MKKIIDKCVCKKYKILFCTFMAALLLFITSCKKTDEAVVKIGLLHSTTGSMAFSEEAVLKAELMAIETLNNSGGVLGHKIEVVKENGESNPSVFAAKARKLIEEDKVVSIFGCWTSDSRKAVKSVVEEYYNLLWYPIQYEGMEASPNIMYVGACPNQQVVPAIDYCFSNLGKRMFLLGSDYVFPQIANKIIKAQLKELGGQCVGEHYVSMEEKDFQSIIQEIKEVKPDVIINTLNGDSNEYFFKQLYQEGLSAKDYPIMSFSISENEISTIGSDYLKGQYVSWSYFATSDSSKSRQFVSRYREKFGGEKRVGEPIEAGYLSIFLWASACEKAGSFDIEAVRIAAKNLSYIAPEGFVTIEGSNQHLNKYARIGRIAEDGSINEVWATENPVRPDPYLSTYAWARGL